MAGEMARLARLHFEPQIAGAEAFRRGMGVDDLERKDLVGGKVRRQRDVCEGVRGRGGDGWGVWKQLGGCDWGMLGQTQRGLDRGL